MVYLCISYVFMPQLIIYEEMKEAPHISSQSLTVHAIICNQDMESYNPHLNTTFIIINQNN